MISPRLIYSIYENRLQKLITKEDLPKHIGLIHDGHRRYARKEGLLSYEVSYKIGMERLKDCLLWCDEAGIGHVTSWLLSRENLARPNEELGPYFEVLNELFEDLLIDDVVDNFKITFIGSTDLLPQKLQETIERLKEVRGGGQKVIFSEFLTAVENGEVLKVEIQGNNIKGVYSNFKRVSFDSDVTLQKLVNRTVERYVTDEEFRKEMNEYLKLQVSGSQF